MADLLKVSSDAGHAGFGVTPGKRALDGSMYEWDFNDGCIRHFMDELSHYSGVGQLRVDDPTGRRDVPLAERCQRANDWGSHLHISFHGNAGPIEANGIETFVHPLGNVRGREIATIVHNHIINSTGRRNRGVKEADFQILRDTKMDAHLIEGGFMTNAEELALMKTDAYRSKVGRAAAHGVVEAFGLKRTVEVVGTIVYIYTGGYAGPALLDIHNHLRTKGYGFIPKRGADGSIVFYVGPFDTSHASFTTAMEEIYVHDSYRKTVTPEQAQA